VLLRLRRWPLLDASLAATIAVASLVQVLADPIAARPLGVAVALGSSLPVAWRRSHPVAAVLVGTGVWLVPTDGFLYLGYVAAFLLFYSLGAYVRDGRTVAGVGTYGVIVATAALALNGEAPGELTGGIPIVVVPTVVGRVVRRQREQAARLEELAGHLERERERGAALAVTEERARIAREMHDSVAHAVSVIAVQANAAEAALDRDPALVRAPLRRIRGAATDALTDMRRSLAMLRAPGVDADLAPQPGLAELPALVDRARGAGLAVDVRADGTPRPLAASVEASAYRIVQEALTNARKHAGGASVVVALRWRPDTLDVQVEDGGGVAQDVAAGANGGHGIVGMRERVRLHGGEFHAGPRTHGGWSVSASLPCEAVRD
jgi:signal transduction histidine kinase